MPVTPDPAPCKCGQKVKIKAVTKCTPIGDLCSTHNSKGGCFLNYEEIEVDCQEIKGGFRRETDNCDARPFGACSTGRCVLTFDFQDKAGKDDFAFLYGTCGGDETSLNADPSRKESQAASVEQIVDSFPESSSKFDTLQSQSPNSVSSVAEQVRPSNASLPTLEITSPVQSDGLQGTEPPTGFTNGSEFREEALSPISPNLPGRIFP